MRIGEVAVVSSPSEAKEIFIQSVCNNLQKASNNICFGRLKINDQLAIILYGITIDEDYSSIAWDLLSAKLLGYVVIFEWDNNSSLNKVKKVIDFFSNSSDAPIIVVANVNDESNIPLSPKFYESSGISITQYYRFIFCQISNPIRAKKVVATIIDILLDKLP